MSTPAQEERHSRPEKAGTDSQVVGEPIAARMRRWRPLLIATAALAAVALATSLMQPKTSKIPYAIDNPGGNGTQALAQLLRDEGLRVRTAGSVPEAVAAGPGATVAVVNIGLLTDDQRAALARSGADITVVGALYQNFDGLTAGMVPQGASATTVLAPRCQEDDAVAAEALQGSQGSVSVDKGVGAVGCFPVDEDRFAYATARLSGGGRLRVVADADLMTNNALARAGHAALAIRALGHHEQLLWLDAAQLSPLSVWDTPSLPPWMPPLMLQLGLAVLVAALALGRRFGRFAREDLPVLVRATETTRGRGRMYRRAADRRRAAQALRSGTALRLGRRLGVPASAEPGDLVEVVARAAGLPDRVVAGVLHGPTPPTDRSLADLAAQLDRLESEVSSP